MKKFKFKIINTSNGEIISGVKNFPSSEDAYKYFLDKGYQIIYIKEVINIDFGLLFSQEIGGIPLKEKIFIVKELYIMISAGVPLLEALDIIANQVTKKSLKQKLVNIFKSVETGTSLSDAFAKEKGILSELHIALLSAGEKSGKLKEVLQQILVDMEKSYKTRSKIIGALIYPAIILIALSVVVVIMVTVMVPQMRDLYASFGLKDLPFFTQAIIRISEIITNTTFMFIFVFLIIFSLIFLSFYSRIENGRFLIDRLKLKLPIVKKIILNSEIARFCRVLFLLLSSGVPIVDALDITSKSLGNSVFKKILSISKDNLIKGQSLSISIVKNDNFNVFPKLLTQIISVGEESGRLTQVLNDMANLYEEELDNLSNNLTKTLEPLLMLLVGVLVMILALAVYTPTLQLIQNIS
ncbi:MAG: type II secretion system F family protein [Candidatus Dojkabacteria bacterium]|nr:type II secretion system F family protein [Candidatus Dojkabacteria bacterium]